MPDQAACDDSAAPAAAACDTLFYDGRCPLCAAEIEALRDVRGDELSLVDIHSIPAAESAAGSGTDFRLPHGEAQAHGNARHPGRDELLRTLHLRRADGRWLTGADANVVAWDGTRRGRALRVLRWPVLRHGVDLVYALWAKWRYWRLYGRQFIEERHAPGSTES